MKKITLTITIIILFSNAQLVTAATWLNCPFGQINDSYPGLCARYIDTDADNICDNSQPAPADRSNQKINPTSSQQNTISYYLIEITIILILFYGLGKYLVYYGRQTQNEFLKKFNPANLRYAMNMILLASFILSSLTALFFLSQIKLGWFLSSKINFSWWHTEFGWIMLVVSVIHIIERWRCFIRK